MNSGDYKLSFVARLPDTFPRHNKFFGIDGGPDASSRRVWFSLVQGQDGEQDLILRQNRVLMDMDDDEKQNPLVLARNVKDFTVEWWGTNEMNKAEWRTEWDDTMTNSIPQMIRVHLVMGSSSARQTANGTETPKFAVTSIYTVPSQMMPVLVQRGIGQGGMGGGPGGPLNGILNGLQQGQQRGTVTPGGGR
jgi:hypothetical protein